MPDLHNSNVVQVLQDFYCKFYCMFYFTCDRSLTGMDKRHDSRSAIATCIDGRRYNRRRRSTAHVYVASCAVANSQLGCQLCSVCCRPSDITWPGNQRLTVLDDNTLLYGPSRSSIFQFTHWLRNMISGCDIDMYAWISSTVCVASSFIELRV